MIALALTVSLLLQMDAEGVLNLANSAESGSEELSNHPDQVGSEVSQNILNALNDALDAARSNRNVSNSAVGTSSNMEDAISNSQSNSKKRDSSTLVITSNFADYLSQTSAVGLSAFTDGSIRQTAAKSQCEREFWLEPGTTLEGNFQGPVGFISSRFKQDPFSVVANEAANGRVCKDAGRRRHCFLKLTAIGHNTGVGCHVLQCSQWTEVATGNRSSLCSGCSDV